MHTLLDNPNRRLIHQTVVEIPLLTTRGVSRRTGIPLGTTRHHLRRLIRAGLVVEEKTSAAIIHHAWPDADPDDVRVRHVLQDEAMLRLHWLIRERGLLRQREILDETDLWGWPRATAQHRLERLVRVGAVGTERGPKYRTYWVVDKDRRDMP